MEAPAGPSKGLNWCRYVVQREVAKRGQEARFLSSSLSEGTFYRRNLTAHYGCVNAIEFSKDGALLASGGDDRRVLLWKFPETLALAKGGGPTTMEAEHRSNVFALAFDPRKEKILSGGNDDQVILHDMNTGKPLDYYMQEQPVYGLSWDPLSGNVFSVAGDDGRLLIYDVRDSSDPHCLAKFQSPFHSVAYHPVEPRLLLTSNVQEGANLWDVRMSKRFLLKYGTNGTAQTGKQYCMNATFNHDGSKVLTLRRRLPPALYSTSSSAHLFQFNHSSYYNGCTMKSCCFGGSGDEFVLAGSDNFDLHMWKIPKEGENRWVNEASVVLKGHRSIVNQVRYNSAHHVIASSGVEKIVKIWSPFPVPDGSAWKDGETGTTTERPRQIYSREEYVRLYMRTTHGHFLIPQLHPPARHTAEDSQMLAFFDALVQRDIAGLSEDESDADTTYTRTVYSSPSTSSSEGEERGSQSPNGIQAEGEDIAPTSRPREMVDFDDLPVIDSDSTIDDDADADPYYEDALEAGSSPGEIESGEETVPSLAGTSEPNTLTKLIETREVQLKKLASSQRKSHCSQNRTHGPGLKRAYSSSSDDEDSEESPVSPIQLASSKRRRLNSAPVYQSSEARQTEEPVAGPSYQLISDLMTGTKRNNTRTLGKTSSSSSSTSSSSTEDGDEREKSSKETSESNLPGPSTDSTGKSISRSVPTAKGKKKPVSSDSESNSSCNVSFSSKSTSENPSDSGIDVYDDNGTPSSRSRKISKPVTKKETETESKRLDRSDDPCEN